MSKSVHQTVSFAAGEWSPKLDARVDQQKYTSALRQNTNMVSYKSGGLTRRIGTQYEANAKLAVSGANNYAVRLISFVFSPTTTFILEFGHLYIRFYSGGQPVTVSSAPTWVTGTNYPAGSFVEDPGSTPANGIYYSAAGLNGGTTQPHSDPTHWVKQTIYEVPSPYAGIYSGSSTPFQTSVFQIKYTQINDIIYIVHDSYAPYSLSRFGDTDWTMVPTIFLSPALLDQNATDTIITPSALQGNGITLTASAPAWVASNYYTIANSVEVSSVIYDCIVANVSGTTFAADLALGYWQAVSIFSPYHIGSTWQLAVLRQSAFAQYGADAGGAQSTAAHGFYAGTSSQIQCLGAYEVHTYGVWAATIQVQRSLDGGQTFQVVQTVVGASDRNVDLSGTAVQLGIYQIVVSNVSVPINPGATAPRVIFECDDSFLDGLVQIVAYTNSRVVTGNVITELTDSNPLQPQWVSGTSYSATNQVSWLFVNYTAANNVMSSTPPPQDPTNWVGTAPGGTEYWSEAAWSIYRGFPQAIASFQQRMIYASSAYEPQRIWGTVTNDIQNFALGDQTLATDAFAFDLNAPGRGPIVWLNSQTDLFVGFSGAEWVVNSGSASASATASGSSITPTNINAFEQGTFGSAPYVQSLIVGNAVFFAQRQADAIRQMLFSVYTAKYMSQDLTTLADHLFASGIVQLAYQGRWRHQAMLWAVTQQGILCGLTYDLDQEVFGWCKAQTGYGQTDSNGNPLANDSGFESVAVIPGNNTSDDETWVVANRLIGGVQTRFIERINPQNWEEVFTVAPNPPGPVLAQAYYVDCGLTVLNPGSLTITGLSYLNGRQVIGLADGSPFGPLTVSGGQVVLPAQIPTTVGTVQIGLPIRYTGQPMRMDSSAVEGNTQGRTKQFYDWILRVWNSIGGSLSNGTTTYPTWTSGMAYTVGYLVISPLTRQAYSCTVANSGTTDPSLSPSYWAATTTPSYQAPVPIPYIPTSTVPGAVPVLVTTPTDYTLPPSLMPTPGHDPVVIITGNDALPITVLGLFPKLDTTSTP